MPIGPPSVDRVNADTSGGGHAVAGAVLGGTAGDGWGRAAAYDAYADGLHTYSLWYLRDHDAAADAVYCAFVAADRNHTNLQQPEQIQPWLYALLRRECRQRAAGTDSPTPVSNRLRPKADALGESGVAASLLQLEGNLRRAEFQSLAWPEAEGLAPAHREVLELTIRHGLDSRGLALVLGLRDGAAGLASSHGFGLLADAWRELERSLAAAAVAASGRDNCAQLAELTFGWSGRLNATLRAPLTEHVDRCSRCQHYLHTVIGTPSAPTMLPFVAAPRALRDTLLGELADLEVAAAAGVDMLALGARCGSFGADGFPARLDPASQGSSNAPAGAGRGPRRRSSGSGRTGRPQRATTGTPGTVVGTVVETVARPQAGSGGTAAPSHKSGSGSDTGGDSSSGTVGFTATAAGTAVLPGRPDGEGGTAAPSSVGFTATASGSAFLHRTPRGGGTATVGFTATASGTAIVGERVPADGAVQQSIDNAPEFGAPPPAAIPVRQGQPPTPIAPSASAAPATPATPAALASGGAAGKNLPALPPLPVPEARRQSEGKPAASPATGVPRRPRVPDADELFRAQGSWAERVLPPEPVSVGGLWRPEPEPGFVQTPSGRFATRQPERERERHGSAAATGRRPAARGTAPGGGTYADYRPAIPAGAPAPGTARLPRYARPGARPVGPARPAPASAPAAPATPGKRPRHKAKPMRQAVISAMALGAVGAVAAAAAAMLGAVAHQHANTTALDAPQGGAEPLGAAAGSASPSTGAGGLTVSVTTGSQTGGTGLGAGLAPTGLAGSVGAGAPTTASSGTFYVSVNQRAADPESVQILLRNAGTGPLHWSATPTVSWLALSQASGTLAPGQSMQVTATATAAAPSGQWSAQIVFGPGGIVVTVHGGIPADTGSATPTPTSSGSGTGAGSGGGTASSSPTTSPTPTPTGGGATSPSPTGTPTGKQTPTATATATGGGTQGSTTPAGGAPTGTGGSKPPTRPVHHR